MAKAVKSLTGPEKDAYLRRAIKAEGGVSAAAAARIAKALERDLARVWVRASALKEPSVAETEATISAAPVDKKSLRNPVNFDPYSPNVIVVLRKSGRERVLEELADIREADHLRLLAREQQLGIAQDLVTAEDIRQAIVAAAERRVANRRAAGR